MKRFFPLMLGLSLILFSFSISNYTTSTLDNDCPTDPSTAASTVKIEVVWDGATLSIPESSSALSLAKICKFHHTIGQNSQSCSPVAADLEIDPDCIGTVSAFVTVTNLNPNPTLGMEYPLLPGTEEMFFEYTAFGNTFTSPSLQYFKYVEDKKYGTQNYHMFECEVEMIFDVSSLCPGAPVTFFLDARLKDEQGQNYDITPHIGGNQMWFCPLFNESCGYCPPAGGCSVMPPPSGEELVWNNVQACAEFCTSCGSGGGKLLAQNSNDPISLDGKTFTLETGEDLNMVTSPNPFSNEVTLNFNYKVDVISSLQILDMAGRSYLNDSNIHIHASSYALNTNDIPSGVYFCKVLVDGKVMTKKIIKL